MKSELSRITGADFSVVIEGSDGVGKETLSRALACVPPLQYHRVEFPNPKYPDTYDRIYRMLEDGSAAKYPSAFQGIQLANRLQWLSDGSRCMPSDSGFVLILDRWDASSYAYGHAAGMDPSEVSQFAGLLPAPDAYVIMHGASFRDKPEDCYEVLDFQELVRHHYKKWCNKCLCGGIPFLEMDMDVLPPERKTKAAILDSTVEWLNAVVSSGGKRCRAQRAAETTERTPIATDVADQKLMSPTSPGRRGPGRHAPRRRRSA